MDPLKLSYLLCYGSINTTSYSNPSYIYGLISRSILDGGEDRISRSFDRRRGCNIAPNNSD
ncbi:hypothetical protein CASFOL_031868 [Castilleja foliolosa]|uniref:Uncharacterized protein n=1 Tax=Castilleja foliolosa TaxID=1961234 RepID=A0ABD3C0G1_9LAMI